MWIKLNNMENDIREFYFKCFTFEIRTSKPRKYYRLGYIEFDYTMKRFQVNTVYLADRISNDTRYLFTIVDHFTKCGLAV